MTPDSSVLKSLEENSSIKTHHLKEMQICLQQAMNALASFDFDELLIKLEELDKIQSQIDNIDFKTNEQNKKLDSESLHILTFPSEGQNIPIWGQKLCQLRREQLSLLKDISKMYTKLTAEASSHSEQLKRKLKGIKKQKELNANFHLQNSLEAGSILNYKEGE